MIKIKINENVLRGMIQEAITNVNSENKKEPLRLKLSEIKQIVKKVLNEGYPRRMDSFTREVSSDFETDDGISFTVSGTVSFSDVGVVSENPDMEYEVDDKTLVDGSYDPMFKNDILNWMLNHDEEINYDLISEAGGNDFTYPGEDDDDHYGEDYDF